MPEINTAQTSETQTTSAPSAEPSHPGINVLSLRPLPTFMYCGDCGAIHYGNDMHFSCDVSGRAYGSCWIDDGDIGTETNEDDNSYENMEYFCDHDDYDVTRDLRKLINYEYKLKEYAQTNNLNLRDEIRAIADGRNYSNVATLIESIDRNGLFIRFSKIDGSGNRTFWEVINPRLFEFAKTLIEQDSDYAFNYADLIYAEVQVAYAQVLERIIQRTATVAIDQGSPIDPNMSAMRSNRPTMTFRPMEFTDNPFVQTREPEDRDPLESGIYQPEHHRRWRDTNLDSICTCVHCAYSFECDLSLEEVVCPKCNKETTNAQVN